LRWVCGLKKNESVFCALANFFVGGLFFKELFFALALKAMSLLSQAFTKLFVQSSKVQSLHCRHSLAGNLNLCAKNLRISTQNWVDWRRFYFVYASYLNKYIP
jgi:hypothetical protein